MFRLEWLFLMQIVMGILMIIFLQKLLQMKKQIDKIVKEITDYIEFVTENGEESVKEDVFFEEQRIKTMQNTQKNTDEKLREIQQNQVIQAVLGEFFP